ncbi:hypothetical protein [Thermus sp.]|uniref:hypothetical protein n=1 Tax=Thermus sp. TaxID=275 RepID=UPI00307DA6BA
MRLEPRRDGNPKPLLLAAYLLGLGLLALSALAAPEEVRPLVSVVVFLEALLMGALVYWIASSPERLHYQLGGDLLVVHGPLRGREVRRADVLRAFPVKYRLPFPWRKGQGTSLPGFHTRRGIPLGRFAFEPPPPGLPKDTPVEAYVGAGKGDGVLLLLRGRALLLNSEDPRPLLEWAGGEG